MASVAEWKRQEVKALTELLKNKKVIGIADISRIPSPQMQRMRKELREIVTIKSSKNNLIFLALDEAEKEKKGISGLKELIKGQTAIIATDIDPFKLYRKLKEIKTNAPAKGGEIAQYDIVIKAGETNFKPGPIVGELQKVGIPAAIQEGKVVIKSDKVIVPKGGKISPEIAQALTRLEIYPIEIAINLSGVFEGGTIFKPDVLDVNIEEILNNLRKASSDAYVLATEISWITKETIKPLLMKAYLNAITLANERGIVNKETIKGLILKAHLNMLALKNLTN